MDQKNSRKAKAGLDSGAEDFSHLSFEEALSQLEAVVKSLENGQLPIADALAAYQRGSGLMRHAQGILNHIQTEIDVIEAGQSRAVDRDTLISQIKE